ncbi:MAG: hypothetical protein AAGF24_04035 [Cyanobacteria bacterium P01_H01_bin.121]
MSEQQAHTQQAGDQMAALLDQCVAELGAEAGETFQLLMSPSTQPIPLTARREKIARVAMGLTANPGYERRPNPMESQIAEVAGCALSSPIATSAI